MVALVFALVLSPAALGASADSTCAVWTADDPPPLVIRAERVLLGDGKVLTPGVILVENGRIAEVGTDVEIPEGTAVVEHAGTASAGMIALHAHSGAPGEMRDTTRTVLPEARVALAYDPAHSDFEAALRAGITSVVICPPPLSLSGGTTALVKTARGTIVARELQLSLGFSAQSLRNDRFPTSQSGAMAELDRLFEKPEGVFARAARGDLPVIFEASSREDVARSVEFAERHDLAGAIHGADWAGELANKIRAADLAVVCAPVNVGETRRTLRAVLALDKAGVPFGFGLEAPGNHPAMLRAGAAMCVREGLSPASAWKALTSQAARIIGAEERVGDLVEDADADIVLWSGDPLDLKSSVKAVYVDGALAWEAKP